MCQIRFKCSVSGNHLKYKWRSQMDSQFIFSRPTNTFREMMCVYGNFKRNLTILLSFWGLYEGTTWNTWHQLVFNSLHMVCVQMLRLSWIHKHHGFTWAWTQYLVIHNQKPNHYDSILLYEIIKATSCNRLIIVNVLDLEYSRKF